MKDKNQGISHSLPFVTHHSSLITHHFPRRVGVGVRKIRELACSLAFSFSFLYFHSHFHCRKAASLPFVTHHPSHITSFPNHFPIDESIHECKNGTRLKDRGQYEETSHSFSDMEILLKETGVPLRKSYRQTGMPYLWTVLRFSVNLQAPCLSRKVGMPSIAMDSGRP